MKETTSSSSFEMQRSAISIDSGFASNRSAGVGEVAFIGYRVEQTGAANVFVFGGIERLISEVIELRDRVSALEAAVSVVEELDWEEALARAREFFNKSAGPIFPTDLAAELATSVSQAVELCDALEEEGLVVSSDGQGKVVKGD